MIAILAIMLTTVLFTSLFTIAVSINDSIEQSNFRQAGGYAHGVFKYLTKEQFEELKDDSLIKEYGLRRFVGMPTDEVFSKNHVEVGYSDKNQAKWMFLNPVKGHLPKEGTNEAATDTKVLKLLGVEPEIGAKFTMTIDVDGVETTENFTLCGWWEYDEAIVANHMLIPQSRAEEIFEKLGTKGEDGLTGTYNLDVMFQSAANIEGKLNEVLNRHGYMDTGDTESGAQHVSIGVNWGYTATQMGRNADPLMVVAVAALLLIIAFTGYLIIYNVFQISVTNDIRLYGLLKTVGTTGRQLKRMIRLQALFLSVVGVPIGLLAGYLVGAGLMPFVLEQMDGAKAGKLSANPVIFAGAAIFSVITVLISCRKPGKMASRVSPVEAVRYTEGSNSKKKVRRAEKGASLPKMAWANLGRNRSKTVVTIISLSFAVVLLNLTVTFTNGFDMDKYLEKAVADFIVADAEYFQVGGFFSKDIAVGEDMISVLNEQEGVRESGRVYGQTGVVMEAVSEEYYRQKNARYLSGEELDEYVKSREHDEKGNVVCGARIYGMEQLALDKLKVIEGDLSKLYEKGNYIAAVYMEDDYGKAEADSHWAKLGNQVTLAYVDEYEFYNTETGEVYEEGNIPESGPIDYRAKKQHEVTYEVAALVVVPNAISYRFYGDDQFVLNDQTFIQDTKTKDVLCCLMDTTEEGRLQMESLLSELTQNQMPRYDYESKQSYAEEFESFRMTFLMLGGVLSFIVGLVGILNFLNAILTGIMTRRREFAVLQSIGMTGRQLKQMLICEGVYYAVLSSVVSFVLIIMTSPLMAELFGGMFWFFTYRFTLLPLLITAPFFVAIGVILPLIIYRIVARQTVVERLREVE